MIYLGNFSYNDELDSTDNYCLMPCIVEADSTDHALELFSEHLIEVANSSDLLDGAKEIFLDSIVELGEVPTTPLMMRQPMPTASMSILTIMRKMKRSMNTRSLATSTILTMSSLRSLARTRNRS
mgnify:CR=1 FL=1